MFNKRQTREAGFSLLELMVCVLFAVLVTGASIPVLGNLYATFKLRSSAEGLVGEMQLAKMRAVNLNSTVSVSISAANKTYQLQGEGLKYLDNSVSFQGTPPATVSFDSRGRLTSGITTTFVLVGSNASTVTITINASGRISVS
jgi:Tfp pilus assembly protein FimT